MISTISTEIKTRSGPTPDPRLANANAAKVGGASQLTDFADDLEVDIGLLEARIGLLADLLGELVLAHHVLRDHAAVLVLVLDDHKLARVGGDGGAGKAENDGGSQNIFQAHGVLLSWDAHGIIKNL